MLRRHQQIRMQLHQLMDACLFAISFWLAHKVRADPDVTRYIQPIFQFFIDLSPVSGSFKDFAWLLVVIPAAPLVLEAQGFYDRPLLCPRRMTLWRLFKGCAFLRSQFIQRPCSGERAGVGVGNGFGFHGWKKAGD